MWVDERGGVNLRVSILFFEPPRLNPPQYDLLDLRGKPQYDFPNREGAKDAKVLYESGTAAGEDG